MVVVVVVVVDGRGVWSLLRETCKVWWCFVLMQTSVTN